MSGPTERNGQRMCPCWCGPLPKDARPNRKWRDHSSCPTRAANREAAGLRPGDDPEGFWGGLVSATLRQRACPVSRRPA